MLKKYKKLKYLKITPWADFTFLKDGFGPCDQSKMKPALPCHFWELALICLNKGSA